MDCSICSNEILPDANGWSRGHNAEPAAEGRCCETCNWGVVIPLRIQLYTAVHIREPRRRGEE